MRQSPHRPAQTVDYSRPRRRLPPAAFPPACRYRASEAPSARDFSAPAVAEDLKPVGAPAKPRAARRRMPPACRLRLRPADSVQTGSSPTIRFRCLPRRTAGRSRRPPAQLARMRVRMPARQVQIPAPPHLRQPTRQLQWTRLQPARSPQLRTLLQPLPLRHSQPAADALPVQPHSHQPPAPPKPPQRAHSPRCPPSQPRLPHRLALRPRPSALPKQQRQPMRPPPWHPALARSARRRSSSCWGRSS